MNMTKTLLSTLAVLAITSTVTFAQTDCDQSSYYLDELSEGFYHADRDGPLIDPATLPSLTYILNARLETGCDGLGEGQMVILDFTGTPEGFIALGGYKPPVDNVVSRKNMEEGEYLAHLFLRAIDLPIYGALVESMFNEALDTSNKNHADANKSFNRVADALMVTKDEWRVPYAVQLIELEAREYIMRTRLNPLNAGGLHVFMDTACVNSKDPETLGLCADLTFATDLRWQTLADGTTLWTRDYFTRSKADLLLRATH